MSSARGACGAVVLLAWALLGLWPSASAEARRSEIERPGTAAASVRARQ